MKILQTVLVSLGSVILLFILTKLMGNRQMSQLSMFDYINGITIGSIAAEMATSLEDDFINPLVAMIVYALVAILISYITSKSIKLRRILTGETLILLNNGKLYEKNFKRAKLDINDFLIQCRNNGYFDIANLQSAILEPNGKISFLPQSSNRPIIPTDLQICPDKETLLTDVIMDGKILNDNLKHTGNDEMWLKKELKSQRISKVEDVFLATCDNNNKLNVYVKNKKVSNRDMFE